MLLSHDYTFMRVAVLPENVLEKLRQRHHKFFQPGAPPLDLKGLNLQISEVLPGREDLITEWVLNCLEKGQGSPRDLPLFVEMAKFFFDHSKEQLFKDVVAEYAEENSLEINPKSLLDFTLYNLDDIKSVYNEEIKNRTINLLPESLPEGSRLIYDDGAHQIVEATGLKAACALAQGTKWCTRKEPWAEGYLAKGTPLFTFYRGKKKWALMTLGRETEGAGAIEISDVKNKAMLIDDEMRDVMIKSGFMDTILKKVTHSFDPNKEFKRFVGTSPNPYIEKVCAKDPLLASLYAKFVTKGRVASSNRINLGDGLYFQDLTNSRFADESSEGELRKEGEDKRVGYLATYIYPEVGHTIADIRVESKWRGQYFGEKMVRAFVQLHGSLASDPQGNTSPDARKMWRRLGAEEIPTNKNTQGFFYILRK